MASMEKSSAAEEEAVFEGVAESRQTMAFHNTTDESIQEPEPQQVATLLPGEEALGKSLEVHQGDTVRLKVNARYETAPQQAQGLEGVATEIAGALEQTATGLESTTTGGGLNGLGATGAVGNQEQEAPDAYLNYLLYDEDYQLIDQGFQKVSEKAAVGKANPEAAAETLTLEVPVEEEGFLYAYLSNEPNGSAGVGVANSGTPVYFDDFTIEQQSFIVQVDDYYPFGLTHRQPLTNPVNKYLYSGKERQTDLNLGWDDFGARFYDPALGRFSGSDPMAEFMPHLTPYRYGLNNPVRFIDPNGLLETDGNGNFRYTEQEEITSVLAGLQKRYGNSAEGGGGKKDIDNEDGQNQDEPNSLVMGLAKFILLVDNAINFYYDNLGLGGTLDIDENATTVEKIDDIVVTYASGKLMTILSRIGGFKKAKRHAKVPVTQKPKAVRRVPMTDRNGKLILDSNGKSIITREYEFVSTENKVIIIQDHSAGHDFGGPGDQSSHFNVRPSENTRTGKVPGTDAHYPFKNE